MSTQQLSERMPWAAFALSCLASGVGHIYSGRIVKGLFLYAARLLLPLLCLVAAFLLPSTTTLFWLILLPAAATVIVFLYAPVDAWTTARKNGKDYAMKDYNKTGLYWLLIAMQLILLLVVIWGTRQHFFEAFVIPERSMSPNSLPGDRILVNKQSIRGGFPQRGDVVVFRTPTEEKGRYWMKRVIGVAGDRIVLKGNEIEINGKVLQRDRVPAESTDPIRGHVFGGSVHMETNSGKRYRVLISDSEDNTDAKEIDVIVPEGNVYLLGDNRNLSRDSRHIGPVHVGDLIGNVDYIFYPAETWSRFGVFGD